MDTDSPAPGVDGLRRDAQPIGVRADSAEIHSAEIHSAEVALERLRHRFGRLERVALKLEGGEPSTDSEHLLAFGIVLAVQAAEDAARSLLILDGAGVGVRDEDLFPRLALFGLLRDEHAAMLVPLQALRTDLVRNYDSIDVRKLVPQLGPKLHALMAFSKAMAGILSGFRA